MSITWPLAIPLVSLHMLLMCAYPSQKPMLKDVNWNPTSAKFETLTCHAKCGEMEL